MNNRLISPSTDPELVELSRAEQVIARRMEHAHATIPDFMVEHVIDMEAAIEFRDGQGGGFSYNDLVVAAVAAALRRHPRANASWSDGRLQVHARVNVGVAIAAERSLVVGTVYDADRMTVAEISAATSALVGKVRASKVGTADVLGQTFTVSNLGMYGVRRFTAVVNPPQAGILAIGAIEPRVVVRDGEITVRRQVTASLSCDHRVLYGADAAALLADVRAGLEAPAQLGPGGAL